MRRLRSSLLAFLAIAAPGVAVAADMPWGRGPTVISERSPYQEEIGTGWYLRGDIGYSKAQAPSFTMGATSLGSAGRDGSFVYGGGFGYKFNEWLRADLTVDQIESYGMKRRIGSVACFTTDTCTIDSGYGGKVMPVMANAYVDFGNWGGFSPYVGGGLGAARLISSGSFTYTDTTTAATVTTYASGGSRWSPAFAAMAGLTIDLGSGIQLDAGYRYLWLSEGSTGVIAQSGAGASVPSTVEFRNNGFHQARVGLRYFVN